MKRRWPTPWLLSLTFACPLLAAEREPVLCLKGLDPVALIQGKEVPGLPAQTSARGLFKYQFASAENKKVFDADPVKYAVQYGGACARTGILSPAGDPNRFVVFEGRIYLFDSESCQKAFEASPKSHIDVDDVRPDATPEQAKEGAKLIERALKGLGGAAKVDAMTSLVTRFVLKPSAEDRKQDVEYSNVVMFPDRYRREERGPAGTAASAINGSDGFRVNNEGWWKMDPIERLYLLRIFQREPVVLLRARNSPGFVAHADGKGKLGERELDFVRVWLDGSTCWLGLDPKTDQILAVRYRGRVMGRIGVLTKVQSDFRDVGGVLYPYGASLLFEGEPIPGSERSLDDVTVNASLDPAMFSPPK